MPTRLVGMERAAQAAEQPMALPTEDVPLYDALQDGQRVVVQMGDSDVEESPLSVLHLQADFLLRTLFWRVSYNVVHCVARLLPAALIYGGSLGLLVCAVCSYRWGVLLALMLHTCHVCVQMTGLFFSSILGVFRLFRDSQERWYVRYCQELEKWEKQDTTGLDVLTETYGDLRWDDVLHLVIIPTYQTPPEVLENTIRSALCFSGAKTNLGICLAFEEREKDVWQKAEDFRQKYSDSVWFFHETVHPPDLPNHLPGKSSNESWAFQQVRAELETRCGVSTFDPRVVLTVLDDDSECHENYFEALTYHFLTAPVTSRYMTTWQPPICCIKNYLRQPSLVRVVSFCSILNELSLLANPLDCHVLYSSYSLSLVLASSVGGWDPDHIAEDWHMFAKCVVKTSGVVRCKPIFLPVVNYTPEEETFWGTVVSRWVQAKRHALGVSEIVYVISTVFLGSLEITSWRKRVIFLVRLLPVLSKYTQVHFMAGISIWLNFTAQVIIHFYIGRSWCYVTAEGSVGVSCRDARVSSTADSITQEQLVVNSLVVYFQQRMSLWMALIGFLSPGVGATYFHLVKDRVEGHIEGTRFSNPLTHWISFECESLAFGIFSLILYVTVPTWVAVGRVVRHGARFTHVVASMVGRVQSQG